MNTFTKFQAGLLSLFVATCGGAMIWVAQGPIMALAGFVLMCLGLGSLFAVIDS